VHRPTRTRLQRSLILLPLAIILRTSLATTTTTTTAAAAAVHVVHVVLCLGSPPGYDVLRVRQVTIIVDVVIVHHCVDNVCTCSKQPSALPTTQGRVRQSTKNRYVDLYVYIYLYFAKTGTANTHRENRQMNSRRPNSHIKTEIHRFETYHHKTTALKVETKTTDAIC